MCWSAAWSRSCWRPARRPAHAVRQWGHVRMFSPWEYNIDKAAERLLAGHGLERPGGLRVPDRRRAGRALSRAAGDPHAAQGPHPDLEPRHRGRPRRLRQDEDQRPRIRRPSTIRYQNGKGPEQLKADAVIDAIGHLVLAQSGGRRRPAGDGRGARGAAADRLRHARRAGPRSRALCRQDGRRAGRRPFGDRHADRSGAARRTRRRPPRSSGCCAATSRRRRSAAAPTTSSRRAARWARPSPRSSSAARSASRPASGSPTSAATASGCASPPARPVLPVESSSTSWSSPPASGPSSISCASCGSSLDPARREPDRAGAADRPQRA